MSFQFPSEIKDLVRGLHDETKWEILELLINNQNKVSYTQIKKGLGIDESKGPLNYHLKELQKSGWIRNWVDNTDDLSDNQKSFYTISDFGLKIIEGMMKGMDLGQYQQNQFQQLGTIFGLSPAEAYETSFTVPSSGAIIGIGAASIGSMIADRNTEYGTSTVVMVKRREMRNSI